MTLWSKCGNRLMLTLAIIAVTFFCFGTVTVSAETSEDFIYSNNWPYQAMYELSKTGLLEGEVAERLAAGEPLSWVEFQITFVKMLENSASSQVTKDNYRILDVTPQQTFYINKILSYISSRNNSGDPIGPLYSGDTLSAPLNFAYDSTLAEKFVPADGEAFSGSFPEDLSSEMLLGIEDTKYYIVTVSSNYTGERMEPIEAVKKSGPSSSLAFEVTSEAAKMTKDGNSPKLSMPPDDDENKLDISTKISLLDTIQISAKIIKDDKDNMSSDLSGTVGFKIGEKDSSGISLEHSFKDVEGVSSGTYPKDTSTYVNLSYVLPEVIKGNDYIAENKVTVNAGYGVLEKNKGAALSSSTLQSSTVLGVNYNLALRNNLFFKAGYRYEQINALNSSGSIITSADYDSIDNSFGLKLDGDYNKINAPNASVKVTSVDIGYNISNNVSVVLGYNLIDFTDVKDLDFTKNKATAEITIKF